MQQKTNSSSQKLLRVAVTILLSGVGLCPVHLSAANPSALQLPANCNGDQIQAALDQLTGGGDVVLPSGTYEIRHPIVLRHDHQTLRGSGPSTVLYLADRANCPVVILGAPGIAPQHPTAHLVLEDLMIDGNRKNQAVELWHTAVDGSQLNNNGINVWKVADALVEHVVCCRCRSGGLVTSSGTRRLTVKDFTAFDNQYDGLACYLTEESSFTKLFLHDNLAAGISLDLAFNHNIIDEALLQGNDLGVFMRDSRENSFQNVTILKSRHHGVFIAQTVVNTPTGREITPGTECVGNKFTDLQIAECGGKDVVINDESCTNNVISEVRYVCKEQSQPSAPPAH
jgi:Periplasmic copper-binding protein (NosD)